MKSELAFFDPVLMNGGGKEKDSRMFVVGVEARTEKEFVILTVSFWI